MELLKKYANTDFDSYEDFYENFKINIPENFNFAYDIADQWAELAPDKRALVWCNDHDQEKVITFSEIRDMSNKTANFLKRLGIRKGDFVMLVLRRHYEFWYCIMALHKIGAIAIPATDLLTTKDYIYRFENADVSAIIATSYGLATSNVDAANYPGLKHKIVVGQSVPGWHDFHCEIEKESTQFARPTGDQATQNDDPSVLYFTSGTTGYPKMVYHDFVYPLAHIVTASFWQRVREDNLHLTVADTGWAKSVWGKLYGQWIAGSVVFVYDYSERFTPTDLLAKIEQYKITTFCAPPTIFRFFIKADMTQFDLSSLKYCVIAGEPLNPEIYQQFLNTTGLKLYEGFGQTETIVSLANFGWDPVRPGSMGKPAPSYDIKLVDEQNVPCEVGKIGQIVIDLTKRKPYGLFKGYYKDQERTDSVIHDGFYYTGDLAWQDEEGYFWYVGRTDDMIKSSGYRIGPFEVESALMEHPAVMETAITAVPDETRGQIVKASIILAKGFEPSDQLKKELQDHVKKTTAPYKYPRVIEFVENLPKTISGKIRRVEIREQSVDI